MEFTHMSNDDDDDDDDDDKKKTEALTDENSVTVTTRIALQDIAYLLVSACEGGSNYWLSRKPAQIQAPAAEHRRQIMDGPTTPADPDHKFWRLYDSPLCTGGSVTFWADGEEQKPLVLDREACARGLQIMAAKYPRHFAAIGTPAADAETGDVWLQCALLGEIVYG